MDWKTLICSSPVPELHFQFWFIKICFSLNFLWSKFLYIVVGCIIVSTLLQVKYQLSFQNITGYCPKVPRLVSYYTLASDHVASEISWWCISIKLQIPCTFSLHKSSCDHVKMVVKSLKILINQNFSCWLYNIVLPDFVSFCCEIASGVLLTSF